MKTPLLLFVIGTLGFGAASAYLWYQVKAERERAALEFQLRRAQEDRLDALEAIRARLERDLRYRVYGRMRASSAAEPDRARLASRVAGRGVEPARDVQALTDRRGQSADMFARWEVQQAERKFALRAAYGGLIKALQLSPTEAEKFTDLMLSSHERARAQLRPSADAPLATDVVRAIRSETDAAVLSLLGPQRFVQYESYRGSLLERARVDEMRAQLDAVNLPLQRTQHEQLLSVMLEEKNTIPRPAFSPALSLAEQREQLREWTNDYEQRVRDRALAILTPEQYRRFDEIYRWQSAAQRMRMAGGR